jgi:hypothetical protein
MPQTKKVAKPKAPATPYFVTKYKNWETKSLPRSWKSASTTAYNNPDWLEDREDMWYKQKRDYKKELRIYQHKLAEYEKAKFQTLRNSVVAQAAHIAKLKSAEYHAEKAIKDAARAAAASAKKVADAERETLKAIKEASKPPTNRAIRMATRATKSSKHRQACNNNQTHKNRN